MMGFVNAHTSVIENLGQDQQVDLKEEYDKHCQGLVNKVKQGWTDTATKMGTHTKGKMDKITQRSQKAMTDISTAAHNRRALVKAAEWELNTRRKKRDKKLDTISVQCQTTMKTAMKNTVAESHKLVKKEMKDHEGLRSRKIYLTVDKLYLEASQKAVAQFKAKMDERLKILNDKKIVQS